MMPPSRYHHGSIILLTSLMLILVNMGTNAQAETSPGATLQGRILYRGTIPPGKTQVIEQDTETCGTANNIFPVVVSQDGGLVHAVVSVEGLSAPSTSSNEDLLIIRNEHCRFQPHIAVGSVKQHLEVQNDDPILHNTHIRTKNRAFFNVVLLPHAQGIKKVIKEPGLMTIECNKHPFMMGYVQVFDHPFYAVTDSQGAFALPNLPPGTHRLTIWHKTLGTIYQTITISPTTTADLTIEFTAR